MYIYIYKVILYTCIYNIYIYHIIELVEVNTHTNKTPQIDASWGWFPGWWFQPLSKILVNGKDYPIYGT